MSDEKQAIAQNISLLLSQNRSAEARVELDRLLALDPEDPESRSMAGDVYAWTGADAAAYKQYNMAADAFNRLGRADKALGVHHKILDLDTSMMDAANQARIRLLSLLVGAEDALVAGQNDKAVAGYSEAIRQFPNHTITYQRLATLLVRLGRHSEAVEQYLTVGRAFYAHGVLPKARPYFERVLELQADQAEALEAVLACLKAENKEDEAPRFMQAAVQRLLETGHNEEAAAWFERLPEGLRDGASNLGAALLLQSEEVGQAERMVAQLDLSRSENRDWFKGMGQAALDRGDSFAADIFFRWGNGQIEASPAAETPVPVSAPVPEIVALVAPAPTLPQPAPAAAPVAPPQLMAPVPLMAPVLAPPLAPPVLAPAPPLGLGLPVPPPGLVPSAPPPGLGLPTPPPGLAPPAPPQGLGVPAPPNALQAPAALPLVETQEDRAILQTMGEMCLAEEMFEEAKQVFERLSKLDPDRGTYVDLLNKARQGLGLAPAEAAEIKAPPVAEPRPAPAAPVLAPPAPVAAPLSPPPVPRAVPPLPLFAAAPAEPAVEAPQEGRPQLEEVGRRGHSNAKGDSHVERPSVEWGDSPYAVGPNAALAEGQAHPAPPPAPIPAMPMPAAVLAPPPLAPPKAVPVPVAAPPVRQVARAEEKVMALASTPSGPSKIVRTAFEVSLGELPPSDPTAIDFSDEIIE
jgi:tetratricopeptide (TPR) repeat protein